MSILHIGEVENAPLAPTKIEVAMVPGKYEGTSFDPLIQIVPVLWNDAEGDGLTMLGVHNCWASLFRADHALAMRNFKANHDGAPLNLSALSRGQKIHLGL
jgi:hypothetical protein